jgi:hypothetical protein
MKTPKRQTRKVAKNKAKMKATGIGRVPVRIPPDAEDVPEISDENEMKFIVDPKDPCVRRLAKRLGWDRVWALDESANTSPWP